MGRLFRNLTEGVSSFLQKGISPANGPLQMGRFCRFRNLVDALLPAAGAVQKGISPAKGLLQMGRLFRNLGEAFLPAAVAGVQKGMKTAKGPLQIGKELRSANLGDSVVDTGPAAARPAANSNP